VGTIWRMLLSARVGPVNKLLAALGIDGPNWLGDPTWAVVSLILIDAWEWLPFVTIIYIAALTSLPREVLKAASVDGASRRQIFVSVIWPMLLPVTVLVAMFRLIDSLLTLDLVFTTTFGGPGFATHTLSFWIYQQGLRYFNISYAAATSWLLLIACMLGAGVFLLWRRRLMRWQVGRWHGWPPPPRAAPAAGSGGGTGAVRGAVPQQRAAGRRVPVGELPSHPGVADARALPRDLRSRRRHAQI